MYHSALTPAVSAAPTERVEFGDSLAFAHDIMSGLPEEYEGCDLLYTDLPWRDGFERFNRRARVEDKRSYRDYLASVASVVNSAKQPTVIVSGLHVRRYLPDADQWFRVKLNGATAIAFVYRAFYEVTENADSIELLKQLANQYDRVGDFCCGYGRTGHAFIRAGKSCVLSDVNPMCIGYIANNYEKWLDEDL